MVKPGGHYYFSHSQLFAQFLALNIKPLIEKTCFWHVTVFKLRSRGKKKIKEILVGKVVFSCFRKKGKHDSER